MSGPGKRVLFFGVTGVEKRAALGRLARWVARHRARPEPQVIDFEAEYLFNIDRGGKDSYEFLDDTHESQRRLWLEAWEKFISETGDVRGEADLYLSMHACFVRGHYGVRSVLDATRIARGFQPDLIVTLLDDVYDMWWRTERRAEGEPLYGRPTIEQLLFARRAELMMADQVAFDPAQAIPSFVVAVAHPCETLANRIYSRRPMVVYLCFPISAPRDLQAAGDRSGVEEVMRFLREAYERQHRNPDLVFVCPLAIDELPLRVALDDPTCRVTIKDEETGEKAVGIKFNRDMRRWSLDEVWPLPECLTSGPPSLDDRRPIPEKQVSDAAGVIDADVSWRDYRLVQQAKDGCLVAFNPKFKNRPGISRSVLQEIFYAFMRCPVFVFQHSEHDKVGVFEGTFPQGGTMHAGPGPQRVRRKETVGAALDAVEDLARRRSP